MKNEKTTSSRQSLMVDKPSSRVRIGMTVTPCLGSTRQRRLFIPSPLPPRSLCIYIIPHSLHIATLTEVRFLKPFMSAG